MEIFIFGSHEGGNSWGEVEEICIIADDENQAWQTLAKEKKAYFRLEDWTLEEVKPLTYGVVFSTSYTLGV